MTQPSLVHNRTVAATLATAAAMLLLGAGCQKAEERQSLILDQGVGLPPSPSAPDASTTLPTQWAEYRSEALGIVIPYPEGWYVSESGTSDQGSGDVIVEFYESEPPPESDAPASAWFERESGTILDALSGLNIASEGVVTRNGRSMTRVEFIEDFYDPNPRVLLFLWEEAGQTLQLGGPNRELVEYIIDRLVVLP